MTAAVATRDALGMDGTFPGVPDSVGVVRRHVCGLLAPRGVDVGDAAVAVSELVTNAIQHSRSGEPGGRVRIAVRPAGRWAMRVEVIDEGCDGDGPVLRDDFDERGRGLRVVEGYALRWGAETRGVMTAVWFEVARNR